MKTYLNTAAVGLVDKKNIRTAQQYFQDLTVDPFNRFMKFMQEEESLLRERAAAFLGTDSDRIAFTSNFSSALNQVVAALEGNKKKVLMYRHDYPSLKMPFERRDFEVKYFDDVDGFTIDLNELEAVIKKEKIEVLPISHVQFLTGFAINISELSKICERNNILCILDITQSFGAVPISFSWPGIDVMISSSYKWIRGGHGASVMVVSEKFIDECPPVGPGFGSVTMTEDGWYYEDSVSGFEPGHPNVPTLLLLSEALNSALQLGIDTINNENNQRVSLLIQGLLTSGMEVLGTNNLENRAHIVCVPISRDKYDKLTLLGFSTTYRNRHMRISPHYYNTMEEIGAFVDAVVTA